MPEGQKAGPKGCKLEVGAQRAPRLLVFYNIQPGLHLLHTARIRARIKGVVQGLYKLVCQFYYSLILLATYNYCYYSLPTTATTSLQQACLSILLLCLDRLAGQHAPRTPARNKQTVNCHCHSREKFETSPQAKRHKL